MLFAEGGNPLKEFIKDPLYYIPYMMGTELRPDRKEIAEKVHNRYLDSRKPYDEQITEIEQVL